MTNDDLAERLDKIIAILQLAHRGAIDDARETIRRDKVSAAILDASRAWIPAGKRIGVLEKRGGGPATAYRSSGLI